MRALAMRVLVGVQPALTHVPPKKWRSMIATDLPAPAKRAAKEGPAWPAPMTMASYLRFIQSRSQRTRQTRMYCALCWPATPAFMLDTSRLGALHECAAPAAGWNRVTRENAAAACCVGRSTLELHADAAVLTRLECPVRGGFLCIRHEGERLRDRIGRIEQGWAGGLRIGRTERSNYHRRCERAF